MAVAYAGGDKLVLNKEYITAAANLADKSLITAAGAAPANAAQGVYGVIEKDVASGDYATVKTSPGIVEVLATGTVTKGYEVEALQATVYANISGTSTSTTSAGVQNIQSAGTSYPIGIAMTSSDAGGTVLVNLYTHQNKAV